MKTAIVKFDNENTITTGINGTDEEIREYYGIGKAFNLGDGNGGDLMAKVVSVEIEGASVYEQLKEAHIQLDNHGSDLYARVNEVSKAILKAYRLKEQVHTFRDNDGKGDMWFDIPFAYEPFWDRKPS